MDSRESIDPELHTLRSAIRGCADGRQKGELETARFQLYAAFESRDEDGARRWSRALRAGLLAVEHEELRSIGMEALSVIEDAIDRDDDG